MDEWWPHVEPFVRRWLEWDGTLSLFEVREYIRAARAQLWCMHVGEIKGIWVTRVERSDGCTWGLVWGCAGDFASHKDDAIAFYSVIEDWFASRGCEFVEWIGREGWSRIFPGYEKHAVVMRKRL